MERTDVMLWVGREFYPTIEDYVDEALRLGCCRRVPAIPSEVTLGETKIMLLHRGATGEPGYLFGYYIADGLIQCSKQQAVVDEIRNGMPLTAIGASGREQMEERGCGGIDPPALYIVGPEDMTVELGLRPPTGRTGRIVTFEPLICVGDLPHWRGYRLVTQDDVAGMISHIGP